MTQIEHFEVKPGPGEPLRCDFCSAPEVRWSYPCRSFLADEFVTAAGKPIFSTSEGNWAACDRCSGYIESGDIEALSLRSYETLLLRHPEVLELPPERLKALHDSLRELHQAFLAHRLGPRVLVR